MLTCSTTRGAGNLCTDFLQNDIFHLLVDSFKYSKVRDNNAYKVEYCIVSITLFYSTKKLKFFLAFTMLKKNNSNKDTWHN